MSEPGGAGEEDKARERKEQRRIHRQLLLIIPVIIGLEFLDLLPMLPSLTFTEAEFLSVVSGIRHPVTHVDRPAAGLLFLPEVWSHHIINS